MSSRRGSNNSVVDLDGDEGISSSRRQNDYPRVAKKSTATEQPKPAPTSNYTTRRQAALASAKALSSDANKFMENFDPETSSRERRKLSRKITPRRVPGALYDENGIHIAADLDLCDCLNRNCAGCHFPCKKCHSKKCGIDCRVNRKYVYEEIEYHGYDFFVKNPIFR